MDYATKQSEAVSGWFTDGDAKIKLVRLSPDEALEIQEKYSSEGCEFVFNEVKDRMERVTWPILDKEYVYEFGAACIAEWENVSIDGKPAECTYENKVKLLKTSLKFNKFVSAALDALKEQVEKDFGSERPSKNSKSTQRKK